MSNTVELLDFLTFSYFGETFSELQKKNIECIARICAIRAYQDLARTLTYKKETPSQNNEKGQIKADNNTNFRDTICGLISSKIKEFFLDPTQDQDFDTWHGTVCNDIVQKGINHDQLTFRKKKDGAETKKFYYGQAQKWLNMTLKYMLLLGVEEVVAKKKYLHVPIDGYILKVVASDDSEYSLVSNLNKQDRDRKMLIKYKNKSWSTINKDQYTCPAKTDNTISETNNGLHDVIRRQILARKWVDVKCPIDWEAKAWIEQAKKERWQKQD